MTDRPVSRRRWLGGGLALGVLGGFATRAEATGPSQTLSFRVRETAGLRRYTYPVHTVVPGPPAGPKYRLELGGKLVPAQFRATTGADGRPALALDFNASPGPFETQDYTVLCGDDVKPGPESNRGLRVAPQKTGFIVSNGPLTSYFVETQGFLRYVQNANLEYVRDDSPGLALHDAEGRLVGPSKSDAKPRFPTALKVTRSGPLAVGLRLVRDECFPAVNPVSSTVDFTFPSSKSWVEAVWTVDDPGGVVGGLELGLNLKTDGQALVDFGAGGTVYGQIRKDEAMGLIAGDFQGHRPQGWAWEVMKSKDGGSPEVVATGSPRFPGPVEGWAHVFDKARCTAVSVDGFGKSKGVRDEIHVDGTGRVNVQRDFRPGGKPIPGGPKTLRVWFHFVPNPVQVGAVTSPQAMLAPLEVAWAAP